VEASDATRKMAEHRLKEKLAQRGGSSRGIGELTPDSSFTRLVEIWLGDLDLEGKIAPSTRALYERNMRQLVMPAFEHFSLREITVSRVEPVHQDPGNDQELQHRETGQNRAEPRSRLSRNTHNLALQRGSFLACHGRVRCGSSQVGG
jgi:hypothetical protein